MDESVVKQLLALKIIVGTLTLGQVVFGAVAIAIVSSQAPAVDSGLFAILMGVLVAIAVLELPGYWVIRRVELDRLRRSAEQDADGLLVRLLASYSKLTIIAAAMVEGLGLFGTVIYLVTANAIGLVGPVLACLALCGMFPTRDKLRNVAIAVFGLNDGAQLLG